ncbi:transcription factor [Coprinellus micaceus]|uniref:Transcription factor n=1 Tax=Coprinellus micaceus TaxID=71717 RepID=A0A4Y7TZR3_COPMI|nr:transcription factor [Coprinellus micaceus]
MDSDDIFAAMGISGFGKSSHKRGLDPRRFDKAKRDTGSEQKDDSAAPSAGPSTPGIAQSHAEPRASPDGSEADVGPQPSANQNQDEPEYNPSEDEEDIEGDFPVTHELLMKDHTKVVTALGMDSSGARVVSGSHDYDCKLWDFGGMTQECKPFKSWEPSGSYPINETKFSPDGSKFLVLPATFQPRIYDRDGEEVATFIKGDPYIRDMKNTAGHVAEVMDCSWHPKEPKTFITSSADSTIRIWDADNKRKQKTVIVVKSKDRGGRTKVTACSYSPDASLIGGACADGAIHLWQTKSNFVRPHRSIEGAHVKGTETGTLAFSLDGHTLMTRGGPGDDTLKLWDTRAFKKPIAVREGLPVGYPRTNAVFSPDDNPTADGGAPSLVFMKKENLEIVKRLQVDSTPVKVMWHPKLNQIVAGLANGRIVVLYSPENSTNGAKLVMSKGPPRKVTIEDMSDALSAPAIITPHALPMFRDMDPGRGTKRKAREGQDGSPQEQTPRAACHRPWKRRTSGGERDAARGAEPALLKYADVADKDPQWTAAWKVNQPKPVFAEEREEAAEEDVL